MATDGRGWRMLSTLARLTSIREQLESEVAVVVKTNGIPFWGRCTTHFRTYFSGDWDVHWGYDLATFDPWPSGH